LFVTAQETKQTDWKNRYSLYASLGLGNVFSDYNYGKGTIFPAQQSNIGYNFKDIFSVNIGHQFFYRHVKNIPHISANSFYGNNVTGKGIYSMLNFSLNLSMIRANRYIIGVSISQSFPPKLLYIDFKGVDYSGNPVSYRSNRPHYYYEYNHYSKAYPEPGIFFNYYINSAWSVKTECILFPFNYISNTVSAGQTQYYNDGDDGTFFNQVTSNVIQCNFHICYHFLTYNK
jgi:hypothetical protein